MRNYTFRPVTEADLPLMRRWLDTAHVKVWWPDADKQITLIENDMDNPKINMQVVSLIGQPFAYLYDHDVRAFNLPQFADLPHGTRAMGTFVGDNDFVGQGHSVAYIEAYVRNLRVKHPMVAAGPGTTDTRTITIYRQARFMNRRLATTREGRLVQVMTHL
ncbi:aminoglycoside 6'-N-acetyltransferase [Yoonia maricola]|uniref:Aminoglycoside 6'-N-acetyltransferase n=1 Tax=Yoonia maricola TaxID=420999 RepID=A0A2M8WNT3_9RHOB|nr:GNAT family N-acetyltransferase [Yoonia maricola]PJI92563.1 aminoglycoside 6'-N-acetyltransferase [Yoonia maricola]